MHHNRNEVLQRVIHEYKLLDKQISKFTQKEWNIFLIRPESKDPWTVKDALAHITYWKSNSVRSILKEPKPSKERGLNTTQVNHLMYKRWHNRSPKEVIAWHRKVQKDAIVALKKSPEKLFGSKERYSDWPCDLDGHSTFHRTKDIAIALKQSTK